MNSRKAKKSAPPRVARRFVSGDLRLMGGAFAADLKRVRDMLPSGRRPVVIAPGTALACVFCLEWLKPGIGSRGEVVVAVPLEPLGSILPNPLSALRSFVAGSSDAIILGVPKHAAEISFRATATHRICTLRERNSLELILELDVQKNASNAAWMKFPWRHVVNIAACTSGESGAVMEFTFSEWGASLPLAGVALRWGRDARAAELKKLGWGVPLLGIDAPGANAILRSGNASGTRSKGRK